MKIFCSTAFVLGAILATGCGKLTSVEPLANKQNVVFDATLVGQWTDEEGSIYIVRDTGSQSYEIDCVNKDGSRDETMALKASLVQLGDQRVLDLSARNEAAFSITGHAFVRVVHVGDNLEVRFIGSDWLQDQIIHSGSPAYFMHEKHPVITASSGELQAFLSTFGLSDAALEEPAILRQLDQ